MALHDGLLLERDQELESMRRGLQRAAEGRGGVLVVEGPAGMGKTALLAAAREAAQRDGIRVLRARGAELEREFAFGVVQQLVEPVLRQAPEAERAALLDGPALLAARLLAIGGLGDPGGDRPIAPDPSFAVLHGLYWLVANLSVQGPTVLVVDDAHWADAASLRFLAFLLPRLEELRVAVLLGARPVEIGAAELVPAVMLDSATEVLRLRPLTVEGVVRLIVAGLRSEPHRDFATACREATGGVPYLVRTLVAALAEQGVAPVQTSVARVPRVATDTVGRWAQLQLGRLGPDVARLARAVAVLERAELGEAAALSELEPERAVRAAELLARTGLLEEQPLAFAHPMLRAGVYSEMPATERAQAHRRAAALLAEHHAGVGRVAEHLLACAPAGDVWVVEQLRAAAQAAAASGAPESAATYLRRALGEPAPPDARAGLLLDLGRNELTAGSRGGRNT